MQELAPPEAPPPTPTELVPPPELEPEAPDWITFEEPEAIIPPIETMEEEAEAPPTPLPEPEPSEPPEWIAAADIEAEIAAVEEIEITEPEPTAFGWVTFGEPEAITPPLEEAPPAPPLAAEPPPESETVGWVSPEEPEPLPEPAEIERVSPPAEEIPAPEIEAEEPIKEPIEEPTPTPAAEPEPAEIPLGAIAEKRAYLKKHARDYQTWLELARELWQTSEREEAIEAYNRVIRGGKLIENVISDLRTHLEEWPDVTVQRTLGDAYMKDGQLQKALDMYRQALERL